MARDANRLSRASLRLLPGDVAGGGPGDDAPSQPIAVFDFRDSGDDTPLPAQPRLENERHRGGAAGSAAGNRAYPDAGHGIDLPDSERRVAAAPEKLGLLRDVLGRRHLNGRVQIADIGPHPFEYDAAPVLEVVGQLRPEGLRIYQRAQLDQMRHRVVVEGVAAASLVTKDAASRRSSRDRGAGTSVA